MTKNADESGAVQAPLLSLLNSDPVLRSVPIGIILRNARGEVVDCNDQAVSILGIPRDEILARTSSDPAFDTWREDGSAFPVDEQPSQVTARTGEPCFDVVMGVAFAHKKRRWVITSTAPVPMNTGEVGVISTFYDVTPRIRSRRILKLVAEANRIVITSKDEGECLAQLCEMLVNLGGYRLAWIGPASFDRTRPIDIRHASGATDYLRGPFSPWWTSIEVHSTGSPTLSHTDSIQVADDLASHDWSESERERAHQFNLGSAIVLPLDPLALDAVIVVFDEAPFVFDETTVAGFRQIVSEIEFGLVHLRSVHRTEVALQELTVANDALRVAEHTLAESEQWFRQLLANSRDLIVVLDDQARVLYANPANASTSGYDPATRLGGDGFAHIHPDDYDHASRAFNDAVNGTGNGEPIIARFVNAKGEWTFLECVLSNCLNDPAIKGIIVNARDVTERTYLSRALRTLSNGNQVLVSATDEAALIEETCRTIVTSGEFLLAWVGLVSDADKIVRPAGMGGRSDYLDEVHVTWDESANGLGPTGTAIRTGTAQVLSDIRQSNWPVAGKKRAEEFGFRTVCAFPLSIGGKVTGALTIFSNEEGAFGLEELSLLGELANSLGYGIARLRDAVRVAENAALQRESEQRFRLAFESNMAPMVFSDLDDRALAVNDAFCRMIGYSKEELIGHDSVHFTYPSDVGITEETIARLNADEVEQVRYVKRYLRKDGRIIISEVSRSPARDEHGKTIYFVSSEREITEERALAEQLTHQALHDPLTGLANRVLFEDRLVQAQSRIKRQGGFGAVLLLDLDDFSAVNDSHGHLVGDELLVQIARRFESVTRASDTLGRFGGDEFLYLAEGLESASQAEDVALRLLDALNEPFSFDEVLFGQHASMGVATWDATSENANDLIQRADVALYEAKHGGKRRFVLFTPRMQQEVMGRFTLVQELRHALQSEELAMHYQPVVDLASTEIVGFEALMRWNHPERGWIPPNVFIPLAEQSELILELGAFALNEAVAAASSWKAAQKGAPRPYVTVNLSARQFQDPDLSTLIEGILQSNGLAPERLIIEITESVTLLDSAETMNIVDRLSRLGVAIALDDFGTGYSSLSYLVRLRPRVIKIDQYFVSPHSDSTYNDALLEAIVSLGNKLDMTMLAEGIETPSQFNRLRELRCELGQGFLFSPAVPAKDVPAMIKKGFPMDPPSDAAARRKGAKASKDAKRS
ncbi:MAG TPA: EAL domain-containing protein [Acidimicrobiales bacterium]|nr:EAL domain-containing protein [Acidimicrobiales bacterium]